MGKNFNLTVHKRRSTHGQQTRKKGNLINHQENAKQTQGDTTQVEVKVKVKKTNKPNIGKDVGN